MKTTWRLFVLVWFAMTLFSCCPAVMRTYSGSARPRSELAVLLAGSSEIGVCAVDGRSTMCLRDTPAGEVEVTPGQHEVEVLWRVIGTSVVPGRVAIGLLRFEAEAGATYTLSATRGSRGAVFWATNGLTGSVVASAGG